METTSSLELADTLRGGPDFYRDRLTRYGPTARGQGWFDEKSQRLRFAAAMKSIPPDGTLLDAGCGTGDFYAYLVEEGWKGQYVVGVDCVPEMIAHARARYPKMPFHCGNIWDINGQADIVVALGVMTFEWDTRRMIQHLWRIARKVLIYTHRSSWGPVDEEVDAVMDPSEALKIIRCPITVIRHDYHGREFMAIHYKAKPNAGG